LSDSGAVPEVKLRVGSSLLLKINKTLTVCIIENYWLAL